MGILEKLFSSKRENVKNAIEPTNDNRDYRSTTIGNQVWMAENLNNSHFRNGDFIPEAKTNREWEKAGNRKQPAWCYFRNSFENGSIYGRLYNWYAITDPRNICPVGYHIPSADEWDTLSDYLGGANIAGDKLKQKGNTYWVIPENGETDTLIKCSEEENIDQEQIKEQIKKLRIGLIEGIIDNHLFTALPGGYRQFDGVFSEIYTHGYWWSSTEDRSDIAWRIEIMYKYSNIISFIGNKGCGFSVRCIKDS